MTVTIDRPDKKNALTQPMYARMVDALREYDSDPGLRALVLTGRGEMFTAGNDLGDFATSSGDGKAPGVQFIEALPAASKPLLAAVNGPAIGIGLTMLLHFDLVFASENANFRAPFVQLGVVPEAGSSILLPAAVGMAMANDILLAGRILDANDALRAGLVSRVLPVDELMPTTSGVAARMANAAPNAMRLSKALIRHDRSQVQAQTAVELRAFDEQLRSSEFKESVRAFTEKRPPRFP